MSTCSGACCAVFPYSISLAEIHRRADSGDEQHQIIADMVIPLAPGEALRRMEEFGVDFGAAGHDWTNEKVIEQRELFTCRHWNEETRLCGIYEDRPRMCADYPYQGKCSACAGCQYTSPGDIISSYAAREVARLAQKDESLQIAR